MQISFRWDQLAVLWVGHNSPHCRHFVWPPKYKHYVSSGSIGKNIQLVTWFCSTSPELPFRMVRPFCPLEWGRVVSQSNSFHFIMKQPSMKTLVCYLCQRSHGTSSYLSPLFRDCFVMNSLFLFQSFFYLRCLTIRDSASASYFYHMCSPTM